MFTVLEIAVAIIAISFGTLLYFGSSRAPFVLYLIPIPIVTMRLLRLGVTYIIEGKK